MTFLTVQSLPGMLSRCYIQQSLSPPLNISEQPALHILVFLFCGFTQAQIRNLWGKMASALNMY